MPVILLLILPRRYAAFVIQALKVVMEGITGLPSPLPASAVFVLSGFFVWSGLGFDGLDGVMILFVPKAIRYSGRHPWHCGPSTFQISAGMRKDSSSHFFKYEYAILEAVQACELRCLLTFGGRLYSLSMHSISAVLGGGAVTRFAASSSSLASSCVSLSCFPCRSWSFMSAECNLEWSCLF